MGPQACLDGRLGGFVPPYPKGWFNSTAATGGLFVGPAHAAYRKRRQGGNMFRAWLIGIRR